ncbi:MAG: G4 quadruplex nucleic acid binding protein [Icmadophila ericetorum]|nr:G4 quadruplex nucleic acid binding protein [Icmadophila ericetorum]
MSALPSHEAVHGIVQRFYPKADLSSTTSSSDISPLSHEIFPGKVYTDSEKVEISQWVTTASRLASPDEDEAKHAERLSSLNTHLSTRTTLLGSKPSIADVVLYAHLAPAVQKWSPEQRTGEKGHHHIVRFIDFVQNAPMFDLSIPEGEKVAIDVNDVRFRPKPVDPKEEKERKKKEKEKEKALSEAAAVYKPAEKPLVVGKGKDKENSKGVTETVKDAAESAKDKATGAAAAAGGSLPTEKKQKKEKGPKPAKQPATKAEEKPLSPALIDLRVGHILKAENHPNADSLYVSTIAMGDAPGTENTFEYQGQVVRTVCSGLNGLIPLGEMQNRKIVAVCNLKPVTMRGIKSCAMVLAASPRIAEGEDPHGHAGPVELVEPPSTAKAGERIYFDGWRGEPENVLNPKKKIWETMQPGFTTTEDLGVAFEVGVVPALEKEKEGKPDLGKLLAESGGECKVKTLKGATVR